LSKLGIPPHSGVYGAQFMAKYPGEYIVQAKLQGVFVDATSKEEVPFLRTTQHIIQVSSATVEITHNSALRVQDQNHVLIDISTTGAGDQLRAYAEVWGKDAQTMQDKAACWIGGIVEINNNVVTLELDTSWLRMAGVHGPLVLKNVYLSDLDTSFPVAIASEDIPVQSSESIKVQPNPFLQITEEMRFGVNPLRARYEAMRNVSDNIPNLLLLPGYCSKTNPWDNQGFTSGTYFNSGGGNLANHAFSQKVLDHLEPLDLPSYGTIGHSQGGMIALHILNYYFTGLELATGARLVQTVGTPWQGCTAAGTLAELGKIFGVGCGSNNDLSIDGAKNWLAGISMASRSKVHLYTTTYEQGTTFGDYCNLAMNIVLQWPNDGTCEIKYGTLPGGVYMGNKQKWCHTTSMKYPPQYTDAARNAEMNREASR